MNVFYKVFISLLLSILFIVCAVSGIWLYQNWDFIRNPNASVNTSITNNNENIYNQINNLIKLKEDYELHKLEIESNLISINNTLDELSVNFDDNIVEINNLIETINNYESELISINSSIDEINSQIVILQNSLNNFSNSNLIINSNFRVNQRGSISYSASGYTVDMWKLENSYGTLTKTDNGIKLSANSGQIYLVQRIEDSLILVNKIVTFSVCLEDGMIYSATDTLLSVQDSYAQVNFEWGNIRVYYYSSSACFAPTITVSNGNSISIKWVKLELGSLATSYVPTPFNEEILKCERYYKQYSGSKPVFLAYGQASSSDTLYVVLSGFRMRYDSSPIISFSNCEIYKSTSSCFSISNISIYSFTNESNIILLSIKTSGLTVGENYYLRMNAGGWLSISCEI